MKIGKYLTIQDITKSQQAIRSGIDNTPDAEGLKAIYYVIENIFDKVKDQFPDCFVSSFYRCPELNAKIGGAKGSQHELGQAVDIDSSVYNKAIFEFIKNNLDFDQLIWEHGNNLQPDWVHCSYKSSGNRKEVLRGALINGKTVYKDFNLL